MPIAVRRFRSASLALFAAAALSGCGDDQEPEPAPTTALTQTAAPSEPLTRGERRRVQRSEAEIVGFCGEVTRFIAGERPRPSAAELAAAFRAIDRYAAVARAKPEAQLRPGVDVRTALGDLAENLEGSNCALDLVARIDQALATIP